MINTIRFRYHSFCFKIAYRLHVAFGEAAYVHNRRRDRVLLDELNHRRTRKEIHQ